MLMKLVDADGSEEIKALDDLSPLDQHLAMFTSVALVQLVDALLERHLDDT
jgi:hypothetical protein